MSKVDRKLFKQIGLLAGVGVLGPAAETASANIVQHQSFTVTSTPATMANPVTSSSGIVMRDDPESTMATFNQFDPSMGTLTEIDISLGSAITGSLTVGGTEQSNNSATATWDASTMFTMPGVSANSGQTVDLSCGPHFCTSSDPLSFPGLGLADSQTGQGNPFFAPYEGTGMVTANFDLDLTVKANSNGAGTATAYGTATWDRIDGVTLTYFFTPAPAPEPATLALLGIGLAGLGFARRRKLK